MESADSQEKYQNLLLYLFMHFTSSPSRFTNQPLTDSIILQNNSPMDLRKRQIQQNRRYHQIALQNFPFGKQGIKISQYVSNQLNSKEQQDNAKILEEFRRKAIEDKFHNKYGHLQNSPMMHKYITQNMLPGVTLNPSIANNFNNELNSKSVVYDSSLRKADVTHHYTQPTNMSNIKNYENLYNARRKVAVNLPYDSIVSYSSLNPEKLTISSEVQTQSNSPQIKKLKEIDIERKYYKLKLKNSKKELKKFDNLQKILRRLNQEIRQNSRFIQKAINKNQKSKRHPKKEPRYTFRQEFDQSDDDSPTRIIYPKPRIKTQTIKDNSIVQNWKLNHQILYNSSTSSSFFNQSRKNLPLKPKIQYTSQPQKNLQKMANFAKSLKPQTKPSRNKYESTRDYRIKDQVQRQADKNGMQEIRSHLKLLKRHTGRLQTINSYSLVS